MNERIRELVKQAGGEFWQRLENDAVNSEAYITFDPPESLEKFVHLIIKDCAETALAKGRASPDTDFRTGSYVISEYLLSRYGVEKCTNESNN